jgi:hypothetical protein
MSDPTWWPDTTLNRSKWGGVAEPVLERIALARDRDRFPHALLLVGPRGLGRELTAVEAAVMLACDGASDPWSVSPCAERVRNGVHPDVRAVLPQGKAGKIKIDQIRAIADEANARPYEAQCRVWILDGVEAGGFVTAAANAFLKTLEEPPPHVRLLLLAENPGAVLPTIRSRCQQLSLPGAAAVADFDEDDGVPPELAGAALSGIKLDGPLSQVHSALRAAKGGEPRHLLRLPYLIGDKVSPFELVATVATEMATEAEGADESEDLIRLAADLLATERRCRALNLSVERQLVACLLRWFQDT